jgi:acyl-coenzyme A thioesterase PaaI-like protein
VQAEYAQLIGMPRGYGYGASMGAWILDTLANWVGEHGSILHSDMKYRAPALTGDVTFVDGRVRDLVDGRQVAVIDVVMTNQRDEVMAQGTAEVRLPPP